MLLIDVGNTRLKWCLHESIDTGAGYRSSVYSKDNITPALDSAFAEIKSQPVWIACVAGEELVEQLSDWFSKQWGVMPVFAQSQASSMGLINAYQQVDALGVDRWLVMLAARHLYQRALCVIDCGTAITMDVVNAAGQHQGGLILPGLSLLQQSLQVKTSAIEQSIETDVLLANNTAAAVGSGCRLMMRKAVPSIVKEFEQQLGVNLLCVLTGGDSHLLRHEFKRYEYREDLVLFGLYLMASQQA